MKVFIKGKLLAALAVLVLPLAVWAADDRPIVERTTPDKEPTTDQEFIAKAININTAEVKMAERALKESENKDVRTFAQKMIDDHTKMRDDLMKLAKAKKVAVVSGLSKETREKMTSLGKLRGGAFDREYMNDMVNGHEKVTKLFKTWSTKAEDSELRNIASKGATKAAEHLRLAKDIQTRLKRS
jgi:putative membrane protein